MKYLIINYNDESVKLYIKEIIEETAVVCNGDSYIPDLTIILERSEPNTFYKACGGTVYLEIVYKCDLDSRKIQDFAIDNKSMCAYYIPNEFWLPEDMGTEEYNRAIELIRNRIEAESNAGKVVCVSHKREKLRWVLTKNRNWFNIEHKITICQKSNGKYKLVLNGQWHHDFNGKTFDSLNDTKKVAEYFWFENNNNSVQNQLENSKKSQYCVMGA